MDLNVISIVFYRTPRTFASNFNMSDGMLALPLVHREPIDLYSIDNSSRRTGRVIFYDYCHYPLLGLSATGPTEWRMDRDT
jgi:hypothetical protein